ncbi:NAD(P)H-hydrate epimerase [Aneurinibacillus soli]|uniref:Bifunctional NAD(P)H-hydrate repair enzyme n=1 Tax=Aneurinibacillus soli TaxID=1500254 RepID=A0A0U5B669_9BACL|nr:NAD(P)H-hydrate dehydratase [Aneurinibacillus soli]PYE58026.1 NAD(P)H-hydrate epimerase [Aneurinibacillus soli]BAU29904.1 Bifunctional NAD(P)H-hydrate repair enzyme Nnr [Aneurinibacillus soli]
MYVVSAQQMRDMDRFTIKHIGIPSLVLMENAGAAVVREISRRWPEGMVVILAGPGNNGGDGLVIARHLANAGRDVRLWLAGDKAKRSQEFCQQLGILDACGYRYEHWRGHEEACMAELGQAAVIVDALLGIGAKGELREPYASIGQAVNVSKSPVVAVDIPTGINSDTGEVANRSVRADLTVTFACLKWGQVLYPGADYCGECVLADISIPERAALAVQACDVWLTESSIRQLLPPRPRFSHKGTYGRALILAGSREMTGAPVLAASAGLHTGCGLLTLAVPESVLPTVTARISEPVFWAIPEENGHFASDSVGRLRERLQSFDVVAIGPGIGTWPGGVRWLAGVINAINVPLILDADALNLLADDLSILAQKRSDIILTPHPGEMGRLCGCSTTEIEKNRPHYARMLAQRYGVYVVLKGAYTLLASPSGQLVVNPTGSAALAKGGSGDVLTGMIAGFIAQMRNTEAGMRLAVYLHGRAGEICGMRSMYASMASDVVQAIGPAIRTVSFAGEASRTDFPGN